MQVRDVGPIRLESGATLNCAEIAYLSFGRLNQEHNNVVLVTHGLTSGPQMLRESDSATGEGTWSKLVGPGLAVDTNRFYVVCPNMLGSSYGSTGPTSIDPLTAKEYGPSFPMISVRDIVASQRKLLDQLAVRHLRAVVGPSYGGIQALQWAIDFPDYVDSIGVIVSGAMFPAGLTAEAVVESLSLDPNWNGGLYYTNGGINASLKRMRVNTLSQYGMREVLADRGLGSVQCADMIDALAETWAAGFDGNSLVALVRAGETFDVREMLPRILPRMLWVTSKTDKVFPPCPVVIDLLSRSGAPTRPIYFELDSNYGHVASGADYLKWEHLLSDLLA